MFYGPPVFDPLFIIAQIIILQSCFYLFAGIWLFLFHILFKFVFNMFKCFFVLKLHWTLQCQNERDSSVKTRQSNRAEFRVVLLCESFACPCSAPVDLYLLLSPSALSVTSLLGWACIIAYLLTAPLWSVACPVVRPLAVVGIGRRMRKRRGGRERNGRLLSIVYSCWLFV
jgi:hypothetical protein